MTPYQKAITGIDEKARDKLIRGLTMTKSATPMTPGYSRASFLDLLAERDRFKDAFLTSSAECERVIAERDSLKSDRARLMEFARVVMLWYENAGNSDPDQKSAGSLQLWVQAKALLRELEGK